MSAWQTIDTAPKGSVRILGRFTHVDRLTGRLKYTKRQTWWGKTSHIPLYGWCWCRRGDWENINLWQPTHWKHLLD